MNSLSHLPFQVQQHPDYSMGVPLKPIKLGIEEPKPGDLAVTAAHKAIRGLKIKRRTEFLIIETILNSVDLQDWIVGLYFDVQNIALRARAGG